MRPLVEKCRKDDCAVLKLLTIDTGLLAVIERIGAAAGTRVHYYKSREWLTQKRDDRTRQEEAIVNGKATPTDTGSAMEKWRAENDGPHKILLMGSQNQVKLAHRLLQKEAGNALGVSKSKPTHLEITNRQASKASALSFLLKKYGLTAAQAMAIGDNHNDIEMLQLAGPGVAMANAPADVKAVADFITANNDEDGIKEALDKFIPQAQP